MSSSSPTAHHPVPAVSVVIAVHNGIPYVEQALHSLMQQTLREIEIIVVDDASTDATPQVLARLAAEDPRLRIATLAQNVGLTGALNHGLDLARAPYVARLDADDISEPPRLEIQKAYLDRHPGVALLGTSLSRMDAQGRYFLARSRPMNSFTSRWVARFQSPIKHPTFMFRRLGPDGQPFLYDPAVPIGQDYEIASRLLDAGDVVCLPDVLVRYRDHQGSISSTRNAEQRALGRRIATLVQSKTLPADLARAMQVFQDLYYGQDKATPARARALCSAFRHMIAHDMTTAPHMRAWMYRQSAALIHVALQRAGMSQAQILRVFLGPGRAFAVPRLIRMLENRDQLPRWLQAGLDP